MIVCDGMEVGNGARFDFSNVVHRLFSPECSNDDDDADGAAGTSFTEKSASRAKIVSVFGGSPAVLTLPDKSDPRFSAAVESLYE